MSGAAVVFAPYGVGGQFGEGGNEWVSSYTDWDWFVQFSYYDLRANGQGMYHAEHRAVAEWALPSSSGGYTVVDAWTDKWH